MTGGRYIFVQSGFSGLRTAVTELLGISDSTVSIEYDFRDGTDDYANSLKTTTAETASGVASQRFQLKIQEPVPNQDARPVTEYKNAHMSNLEVAQRPQTNKIKWPLPLYNR